MNWFEHQRHQWILDMLHVYGFINRDHIVRKFDISVPQASKDLQKFMKTYPTIMRYDLKQKRYVRIS